MADLMLACTPPGRPPIGADRLSRAALRLAPQGGLPPRRPLVLQQGPVTVAIANGGAEGVRLHGAAHADGGQEKANGAALVGGLFAAPSDWWRTGAGAPDGTYALLRWDGGAVEALTDLCGSRSVWFALTDRAFVAATSQRALVMLLGEFRLDPQATACFLSSGTLGPDASWDARARRLPPDTRLELDQRSWTLALHSGSFELNTGSAHGADVEDLRAAMTETCASLDLDMARWVLPLSGGHDSRALLAFLLQNGLRPHCVTWTTRASLRNPLSDASIARLLARRFGVEHRLLYLDDANVDLDEVLSRFVAADEGCNDEIAGYLDGFAMWRDLASSGVEGIIRGDQSFGVGSRPMLAEDSRRQVGGATPTDYPEEHLLRRLGLAAQVWPERLRLRDDENLIDYRLRLSQDGFIPIKLAGLNHAKAQYVELVNPHLSRRVLGVVRALPPELRKGRAAYLRIVDGIAPFVPYSRASSTASSPGLLRRPEMLGLLVAELTGPAMQEVLSENARLQVLTGLSVAAGERPGVRKRLRALVKEASGALPSRLAERLAPAWKGPEALSAAHLAFRCLLAARTIALLQKDARDADT